MRTSSCSRWNPERQKAAVKLSDGEDFDPVAEWNRILGEEDASVELHAPVTATESVVGDIDPIEAALAENERVAKAAAELILADEALLARAS